jgi:excisionase family DNA binding protein
MSDEWMTEAVAAEWLGVSIKEVRDAVGRGELPSLRIGGRARLSRKALLALGGAAPTGDDDSLDGSVAPVESQVAVSAAQPAQSAGLPAPSGMEWRTPLGSAAAFEHRWPAQGGSSIEPYPKAWGGAISLKGKDMKVLVGEATGAERRDGKRRLTVLIDGYPMAEFVPTAAGDGWVSLIKPDGRHTVSPSSPLPRLYREARVEPNQQATGLSGQGRPTGAALVIDGDDVDSAVHHAAARWLGAKGFPVEPGRAPTGT